MQFADGDFAHAPLSLQGIALLVVVFIIGMGVKVWRDRQDRMERKRREKSARFVDENLKKREEEE